VSFDLSRYTFNPWNDYSGVVKEQGRVDTDADWNEWLAEVSRRIQAGTLDTVGHAVYPTTTPFAFQISASSSGGTNSVRIGVGRMYVDGILVENHGLLANAQWDPALAELSNTPQPPPSSPPTTWDDTNSIDYHQQPYNIAAANDSWSAGSYLAYLDVWRRPITFIEDATLVDPAIGVDTSGRVQTAWQVKLMPAPAETVTGAAGAISGVFVPGETAKQTSTNAQAAVIGVIGGSSPELLLGTISGGTADATDTWVGQTSGAVFTPSAAPSTTAWTSCPSDSGVPWPGSGGLLQFSTVPVPTSGPCCLTADTGYIGAENQFYRVEIHNGGVGNGTTTGATFKWSRENASVQTNVTAITAGSNSEGGPASVLNVLSLGRDQVLGFSAGDWIEIANQTSDGRCLPGELCQIDSVQPATSTITLTTTLTGNWAAALPANSYTRVCRWDQSGTVYESDNKTVYWDFNASGGGQGIPVPPPGTVLILENGLTVQFSLNSAIGAGFQPMDFWTFPARTADPTAAELGPQPPAGLHHHYAKLAVVTFPSSGTATAGDCRTQWPPPAGGSSCDCCCSVTAASGVGTITAALATLPGGSGEICLLPGVYYDNVVLNGLKNVVIRGCGRQTLVCSTALQTGGSSGAAPTPASSLGQAVFTLQACDNVELTCFGILAADDEFGVLLDAPLFGKPGQAPNRGIVLQDLELEASTRCAAAAIETENFRMCANRVLMKDKPSRYAAVYMSGEDLLFAHNWVGVGEGRSSDRAHLTPPPAPPPAPPGPAPAGASAFQTQMEPASATNINIDTIGITHVIANGLSARGGVQLGGPSRTVCIVENRIQGGGSNGVTLGNLVTSDSKGVKWMIDIGVQTGLDDPCNEGGSGGVPGQGGSGGTPVTYAAGGLIENVRIDRNCISDMGMCGIGPLGFFDFREKQEVISVENIAICDNVIFSTLKRRMATDFGYGAVSLPDVVNLTVRDNFIVDFGHTPGAEVCGVYVLHGEGIEISRNQIRETRDDDGDSRLEPQARYGGRRAGVFIEAATPPPIAPSSTLMKATKATKAELEFTRADAFRKKQMYEPGLPALRVHENVVRVAFGMALYAVGWGPFTILNNSFGTGGAVALGTGAGALSYETKVTEYAPAGSTALAEGGATPALTVGVLNIGQALEIVSLAALVDRAVAKYEFQRTFADIYPGGSIMFANNLCRYEGQANGATGLSSVALISPDLIQFGQNHLWFDASQDWTYVNNTLSPGTALVDALLLAGTVQANGNRLQEAVPYPVLFSGFTFGLENITTHNIATYCIVAAGAKKFVTPNIETFTTLCPDDAKTRGLAGAEPAKAEQTP
jgi:hypothetical protein